MSRFVTQVHRWDALAKRHFATKAFICMSLAIAVQDLPHVETKVDGSRSGSGTDPLRRSDHMGTETMAALEAKLRSYEDELIRLRIENEQLRQSSQAFGELAERLSVALRTATRVNRRSATAADNSGRRRALAES